MEKVTRITGQVAYLPLANIDTDMIIPKQYLKTVKRSGLGRWLFAEQRYAPDGSPVDTFVLNRQPQAKILLAGANFGCGSSREHAPWALIDFGLRAVIAPDFADIFYNNAYKNGLLLIRMEQEKIDAIAKQNVPVTINLQSQSLDCGALSLSFAIEPDIKATLLGGWDPIEHILTDQQDIMVFQNRHFTENPWLKDTHNA